MRILRNMKLAKFVTRFTRDSIWVSLGFGINALSALIIGILLTRILDAENVGAYFLVFSLIVIFSTFSQLGLNTTVVKTIGGATQKTKKTTLNRTVIKMLWMVLSAGALIMIFFMSDFSALFFIVFKPMSLISSSMHVVGIVILLTAARMFIAEVFRGFHDIRRAALYQRILPNVLILFLLFLIFYANLQVDLNIVLDVLLLVNTVLAIAIFFPFKRKLDGLPGNDSLPAGQLLSSSMPIAMSQLLQLVFSQIPLWVLGVTALAEDVAEYGVAFRLAALVSLPLLVANNVIMPHVAKHYSVGNISGLNDLVQVAVAITSFIALLFMAVFCMFGKEFLGLLFGEEYMSAYMILLIIGFGQVANVFFGSPAVVLAMAGKEMYVLYSNFFALIVVSVVSVLAVPVYGATGAAIATAVGLAVVNLFLVYYSYRMVGCKTYMSAASVKSIKCRLLG